MEKALQTLLDFVLKKDFLQIKKKLDEHPSHEKGTLFECFLTELLKGNGYIAKRNGKKNDLGADILIYSPTHSKKVVRIIQAKNHKNPLDKNDVRLEVLKFEEEATHSYHCKYYTLISLNGYSEEALKYENVSNVALKEWSYIEELITNYQNKKQNQPKIDLYPHNEKTFKNIKKIWKTHNRSCAIQATGTGKTFLIVKSLFEFPKQKKLVLAPSEHIFKHVEEHGGWFFEDIEYMTYSKLIRLTESEMKQLQPSLIVLDEFHRTGAKKWGESVQSLLTLHPNAKVLGTTATPIRYLDGSRNMANEIFQNQEATNLSLSDAIVRKILPMPTYICALYTAEEEMKKLTNTIDKFHHSKQVKDKWNKQIRSFKINWESANGIPSVLKKHITKEKKFIVFCKNKEHLEQMEWLVESWFKKSKLTNKVDKYRVISHEKRNKKQLEAFIKNNDPHSVKLLFSIDMLNEGLHVDSVDGVILLRPTESPIIFYQQIGRSIQANKNESPLIFDFVNNFSSIRANDFSNDIQKSKRVFEKKRKEAGLNTLNIQFTINDETKEMIAFEKTIQKKIHNPWEWKFEELLSYKEEHGHVLVYKIKETRLGLAYWCKQQRSLYEKGMLKQEQIDRLNEIGFQWDEKEEIWLDHLEELRTFKAIHGHTFPSKHTAWGNLKPWILEQRRLQEKQVLDQEKVHRLHEIQFAWSIEDYNWDFVFNIAKEHRFFEGICIISNTNHFGELEEWVTLQKNKFKSNQLQASQIEKLQSIGILSKENTYKEKETVSKETLQYDPKKTVNFILVDEKDIRTQRAGKQKEDITQPEITEEEPTKQETIKEEPTKDEIVKKETIPVTKKETTKEVEEKETPLQHNTSILVPRKRIAKRTLFSHMVYKLKTLFKKTS